MGATQHPIGALFVVHGCLVPLLMLVQRFEVASEIGCKRICVRVPVLIGIGFLFLRLSFPRLLCFGPLSLSAAMTAPTSVAPHASSVWLWVAAVSVFP